MKQSGEKNNIPEQKPFGLAVSALIDDGAGRYLFLKRSSASTHFAGQWETPGGKIDAGEGFDEALIREVKEETSLDIALNGVAGATQFELPTLRVVLLHMWASVIGGSVKLSDEHQDYEWVTAEALGRKDLCEKVQPIPALLASRQHASSSPTREHAR